MTKGVKRDYEAMPVSDEDAAYVRALVIHEDSGIIAFNKPSGLPVQTRNVDDRTLDRLMAAFARSNGKRPRLVHRLDAQTSGVILAALYLLWAYQGVFHGPVTEGNEGFRELRWTEGLIIAPLLFLIVFLGLYPAPMLERIGPSVDALVAHVDEQVDSFTQVDISYIGAADVPAAGHGEEGGE